MAKSEVTAIEPAPAPKKPKHWIGALKELKPDKSELDQLKLSVKQSKTDKVQVQIDFLVRLGASELVNPQTFANYQKATEAEHQLQSVFVEKHLLEKFVK